MADRPTVILSGFADEAANQKTAEQQFSAFASLGLQYYTIRFIDAGKGIKNVIARPISRVAQEKIDHSCRTAFRALWLRDYARLDIRLDGNDEAWVLEANANPFLSFGHEISQAAEKSGMKHGDLLQRIIDEALAR